MCLLTGVTVPAPSDHRPAAASQSVLLRHLLLETLNTLWLGPKQEVAVSPPKCYS